MMIKFHPMTRSYAEHKVPADWDCVTYSEDLEKVVNCAQCGKLLPMGECYTSLEVQTDAGFGYGVCEDCYRREWNTRREARKWLRVLMKKPGEAPFWTMVKDTVEGLQKAVGGGYFESYPLNSHTFVFCDEEGKLKNLPYNCTINGEAFMGTIFFCDVLGDELGDLGEQTGQKLIQALTLGEGANG